MPKPKTGLPPEYPKHCPCGHKNISWSVDEEDVFVGTATENTHFLSISAHGLSLPWQRLNKRSPVNSWIERNRE